MAGDRPREHTRRIMFKAGNRHAQSSAEALGGTRDGLVEEAFARYLEWRRHSSTCELAYRRWATSAGPCDSALAFATYNAALDREERAAARYERACAAAGAVARP